MTDTNYSLEPDQLQVLSRVHDQLHADIVDKSREAGREAALEVVGELRIEIAKVSGTSVQVQEIRDVLITGLDGNPGMAENVRNIGLEQTKQRTDIDELKSSAIPWKRVAAIASGIVAVPAVFVVLLKVGSWLFKHMPLAVLLLLC